MKILTGISFFFLVIMLLCISPAFAAVTFTVGSSSECSDGAIEIPVSVDNASGVAGVTLAVDFDSLNLTLIDVRSDFFDVLNPTVLGYGKSLLKNDALPGALISGARSTAYECTDCSTELLTLVFVLNEGSPFDAYEVTLAETTVENTDAGYPAGGSAVPMLVGADLSTDTLANAYPVLSGAGDTINAGSVTFVDSDSDDVWDCVDNCPDDANTDQADEDGDGIGDVCESQESDFERDDDNDGYNEIEGDCDDTDPDVNPGAEEIPYNGKNDDCDESTPDDDVDEDGYLVADDCDDNDPDVNPGAVEIVDNGKDDDCDPSTPDSSADVDNDGDGYTQNEGDCDDGNADIYPGATEVCNETDDDCDGTVDEDIVIPTFYADADADGFGDSTDSVQACTAPEGYVSDNTDCNDADAGINPGVNEILDNGIDDDCNPLTPDDSLEVDSDEDGMPDYWETNFGLSPFNDSDADDDPDGDGFTNLEEYLGITSPKDGEEFPTRPTVKEAHPHPGQGIDAGTLNVPNDASLVVWLKDDTGIDVSEGAYSITVKAGGQPISGGLSHEPVLQNDDSQYWLMFQPDENFTNGVTVEVTVTAKDEKGVSMEPYTYQFRVESNTNTNTPAISTTVAENYGGTETLTITAQSDIQGAVISYTYDPDDSPVMPRFGSLDEIPELEEDNGLGLPINLEPPMLFPNPVTVKIPCPGTADVSNLDIYYYTSQNGWVLAYDHEKGLREGGRGWMVEKNGYYRVDNNDTDPKTIEIYLKHFSAVQAAGETVSEPINDDDSNDNSNHSSGGSSSVCFISTILGN